MKIAFYGSSLLSSWWNGAATYYRGLLHALAKRGYEISFYEPDAFDRQRHRDIEPPDWARSVVWPANEAGLAAVLEEAMEADIVIKASGVGVYDTELLEGILRHARSDALTAFWDVDAAASLAEMSRDTAHPLRWVLPQLDIVFTYGGGPPVITAYRQLGAARCVAVYNAVDPATHHPAPPHPAFAVDLALLANRLPDREERIEEFFLRPARLMPEKQFLLGGNGWDGKEMPPNVRWVGHVGTAMHNAFNCSPLALLNVARKSMAETGFSPATRVFEAAGAGACLITDAWEGVELFLEPGSEILVATDGKEVAEILQNLTTARATGIGQAALRRVLSEHTYEKRAAEVDGAIRAVRETRREEAA